MLLTSFSFAMSVWTVIFLMILFFLYRYYGEQRYEMGTLIFVLSLCLIRTVLPFEFSFTKVVPFRFLYNPIFDFMTYKLIYGIQVWMVLLCIWILVAVIGMIRCIVLRVTLSGWVENTGKDITDLVVEALDSVKKKTGKAIKVNVYEIPGVVYPFSYGLFKKVIVIPEHENEEKLYYILLHEYQHQVHGDLWIMTIIDFWVAFLWWNPFSYLLRHKMEENLELNCDYLVTRSMSAIEKKAYLKTIMAALAGIADNQQRLLASTIGLVKFKKDAFILERFKSVVANRNIVLLRLRSIAFVIICLLSFAGSYTFIFQSSFPMEDNNETGFEVVPDEMRIIESGEGYYVYKEDTLIGLITDYDSLIPLIELGVEIVESGEEICE